MLLDGTSGATAGADHRCITKCHATASDSALLAEEKYSAKNYESLPIVFAYARGANVWDPEGNHYLDFHSGSTALNHGHCHPELLLALYAQASCLTLTSRAFHNDVYPRFAELVTKTYGYDRVLPTSTGAEACEVAIKAARKWAYMVKGVPENQAIVLGAAGNHHGRTLGPTSLSSDTMTRDNYGPLLPNVGCSIPGSDKPIIYNDITSLRQAFKAAGPNLAAFFVEPIQGDAGVIIGTDEYLCEIRDLCDQYNALMVCDEIQTGMGRTGKLLASYWSGVRPDMILLGKAMTGGMLPASCVLGSDEVILSIEPGTHGSTYGGNPLGAAVAIRALQVLEEEGLIERANRLGGILRKGLRSIQAGNPLLKVVRGRGLLNAIVIDESQSNGHSTRELCQLMKGKGLLLNAGRHGIIRITPPLVITDKQLQRGLAVIREAIEELPYLHKAA